MPPVIIKTSTPDANGGNPLNAYSLDLGSGMADVLPGVLIDPDALKPIGSGAGSVGLPISGPADLTVTGTLSAPGDTVQIALSGRRGVAAWLSDNVGGLTMLGEASLDGGTAWFNIPMWDLNNLIWVYTFPGFGPSHGLLALTVPMTHFRIRRSAGVGAAVSVTLIATAAPNQMAVSFPARGNAAAPSIIFKSYDGGGTLRDLIAVPVGGGNYALGTAFYDGVNVQALKAASTPAVAADAAAVVALSPNSPPATGIADTLFASGDVASPTGGAAIATLTTPVAGTYRLDLTCYSYVGNLVASVGPDMELRKGAAVQIAKLGGISAAKDGTVTPGVAGTPSRLTNLRVTLDGSTNLSINATAGGTANYVAQLTATRLA